MVFESTPFIRRCLLINHAKLGFWFEEQQSTTKRNKAQQSQALLALCMPFVSPLLSLEEFVGLIVEFD